MKIHRGLWWTPNVPDQPIAGSLIVDQVEGITLDLDCITSSEKAESLTDVVSMRHSTDVKPNLIVHGRSQEGVAFTLYNGFVRHAGDRSSGLSNALIYFNRGIEGWAFEDPTSVNVAKIHSRFHGLVAWMDHNPFKIEYRSRLRDTFITHKLPKAIRVQIDPDRLLTLSWDRQGPTKSIIQTEVNVHSTPAIGIEYSSPRSLDNAIDDLGICGDLLTLLLGAPTVGYDSEFFSSQAIRAIGKRRYPARLRPIGARFQLKDKLADWMPDDVLLPLPQLRSALDQVFSKWFELHKRCWAAINPYFASLRTPGPFVNDRFFALASSAESLHRSLRPRRPPIPRAEWNRIREAVLASVESHRREYVCSRLNFEKDLNYRDRLKELISRFPTLHAEVIGDSDLQEEFCDRVTSLRNIEAHKFDRKKSSTSGPAIEKLTAKLRVIIDSWLLAECGIPGETIEASFRGNRRYWYYADNKTWPWNK
ncbi:MAG: hypothetical protein HS101_14365 [Planctomycetia bacterium]|nr:hypothetical protein [Planctomycetia bacterium]MCC7314571.1 hypothetical protein [Planctomycetota bacterium]